MHISVLSLILLILLAGCDTPVEPPPPPRPALVMIVGQKAVDNSMSLVGEVTPRYTSSQSFRINGKIIKRFVDVGAKIKKGQLLARLDATDSNLSTTAAMADVHEAEASHALAVLEVERQRLLFAKKFISASALDIKEAELKASSAKLAKAKAQANVTGNQTQYTNLTADRDGVVTLILAEPGQVIQAGEEIVQIADTKEVEVLIAVPESRMAEVKPKAPVEIHMWADRETTYTGIVREISPEANPASRAFNVKISIADADSKIKLGMTAGVKFKMAQSESDKGFLIPSKAITEINGKTTVWIINSNDQAESRAVVVGQFREDGTLITEGLQSGDRIAIAGVHTLFANQKVKPIVEAKQ